MNARVEPLISKRSEMSSDPIAYTGVCLSRYEFCTDMVVTLNEVPSASKSVPAGTMYHIPRFWSKSWALLNMSGM